MQAARGASLTESDQHTEQPESRPRRRHLLLFGGIAVLGYAVDLLTKLLAVAHLRPGDSVPLVGDLFTLYIARNPGAAFSTGTSYTFVLSCIAIVAAVAVLWVSRRLGSAGWAVGLGFLLAGILGNLTDRVFRAPSVLQGHVVDFLRLPNFPVFNIADVCINIAAGVIIVQALRGMNVNGTRHHDAESDAGEASQP
jgi:signal peptidase II